MVAPSIVIPIATGVNISKRKKGIVISQFFLNKFVKKIRPRMRKTKSNK